MHLLIDYNDEEIYVCETNGEARALWQKEPAKRPRIYLQADYIKTVSMDTHHVEAIVQAQRKGVSFADAVKTLSQQEAA